MKITAIAVIVPALCLIACSTPKVPRERTVSISAKPKFKQEYDRYYTFEANGSDGKKSIYWPDAAPKPSSLNKSHVYQLDLIEDEQNLLGDDDLEGAYWTPKLSQVHDGEKLLYDASVCSKHEVRMDRKLVSISYGLPSFTPEWKEISKNAPNAGEVLGGCSSDGKVHKTRTWVCPVCQKIREDAIARMAKRNKE